MDIPPEVRTTAGAVRGRWRDGVANFRGIPYAQPPVGPRRFRAPVPVQQWAGVLDALDFGPRAPQTARRAAAAADDTDSTDWLTLNVWSPDLGAARLPVMVWIHGGAYLRDASSNPHYDGATLARAGAVVVSMNYRTGFEGFAHIAGAPENRGLLDQIAALRWVQDNIAAFGGDPDNVTVFGESAGGGSVAALLAMPSTNGLFHRAIAQSVPGTFFSTRLAAAISTTIAAELGAPATVDELAGVPPYRLINATRAVMEKMPTMLDSWGPMALTVTPFSPVVDGDLLPQAPWRALASGTARDIDLLVGHTRDEFSLLANELGEVTDQQLAVALEWLTPSPDGSRACRDAFPTAAATELHELVNADWLMRMSSLHLAEAQHAGGGNAWTFELCWGFNTEDRASHALDALLVLGTLGDDMVSSHPSAVPNAAAEAVRVSEQMRTDWLNFATGDPGWPPYDPDARITRVYNAEPSTVPYPEETSRQIWRNHRFDTLDLP